MVETLSLSISQRYIILNIIDAGVLGKYERKVFSLQYINLRQWFQLHRPIIGLLIVWLFCKLIDPLWHRGQVIGTVIIATRTNLYQNILSFSILISYIYFKSICNVSW